MEMRPARGRAKAIFGNKRFCCPKCGAKASSFFDIDDVDDPRAVERLERLERMKNEDEEAGIEPEMDDDPTE